MRERAARRLHDHPHIRVSPLKRGGPVGERRDGAPHRRVRHEASSPTGTPAPLGKSSSTQVGFIELAGTTHVDAAPHRLVGERVARTGFGRRIVSTSIESGVLTDMAGITHRSLPGFQGNNAGLRRSFAGRQPKQHHQDRRGQSIRPEPTATPHEPRVHDLHLAAPLRERLERGIVEREDILLISDPDRYLEPFGCVHGIVEHLARA